MVPKNLLGAPISLQTLPENGFTRISPEPKKTWGPHGLPGGKPVVPSWAAIALCGPTCCDHSPWFCPQGAAVDLVTHSPVVEDFTPLPYAGEGDVAIKVTVVGARHQELRQATFSIADRSRILSHGL